MTSIPTTEGKVSLQFASCSGEGFQLEILVGGRDGESSPHHLTPIARIVADDDETHWFEFFTADGCIRVLLSEIEKAIAVGKSDVHGEAWYDK